MPFQLKQLLGGLLTIVLLGGGTIAAAMTSQSGLLQALAGVSIVAGFGTGYATIGWIVIPE